MHVAPFPSRLVKPAKVDEDKNVLDTFRKVKVNIQLLDVIQKNQNL